MTEPGGSSGGQQQQSGDVTPPRAGAEGGAQGSPAGKRSRVDAMLVPTVDASEHYNHEELAQQVRMLKAQMLVVGVYTEDLLTKHNTFVGDVEQGIGGLMDTTAQQWRDMVTLKNGCQAIEAEVRVVHERMCQFEGFRAENGEKLDFIATAAQNFQTQVLDMEASLKAKVEKVELETVPADLRRAHAGMTAELAKFRAECAGGPSSLQMDTRVATLIAEALGSETFEEALLGPIGSKAQRPA